MKLDVTLNDIINEKLSELEIHKWWDYGNFEEIRDIEATASSIEESVKNYFIDKIRKAINELDSKNDCMTITGLNLAIEIIEE